MTQTAEQISILSAAEVRNFKVDFSGLLDSGELLTGTPLVVEVTSTDLTITNKAVSTAELVILEQTVAVGKAVTFTVSGQAEDTIYTIKITVGTDATNAQTFVRNVKFVVR